MAAADVVKLLQRLPLFSALGVDEALGLAQEASGLRYAPGMRLFAEGDPGDSVVVIVSGAVQVSCAVPDGPDLVLATEGPGALLGEMALLDPAPRSATAVATEDTVVLHVSAKSFAKLVSNANPAASSILRSIARTACARLRGLEAKVDRLLAGEGDDAGPALERERKELER
jgi:CRP/FNR family transcriptional regulator